MTRLLVAALFLSFNACAQPPQPAKPDTMTTTANYLDLPFQTIAGETTSLAAFKGKVLLLVNVASQCGYTPQYEGLESLYKQFKDKGLVVIGFPANNFGEQEPGTNAEILHFCKSTYGVTFPMMAKISVKGEDIHPLYEYLTTHSEPAGDIAWNFDKFLLDKTGRIAARYDRKVTPADPALVAKIESLLTENSKSQSPNPK